MAMIRLRGISKVYQMGSMTVQALRPLDLEVERGEFVAIMGPSGSGKSTLMNILGCLDKPSSGLYELDGLPVSSFGEDRLAEVRNRRIGFVFQSFNLLPRLPALQQVELPLAYRGIPRRRELAANALRELGLADRMNHRPTELSGGQQQRIAIARALVSNPSLILADEPTGALDTSTSHEIMDVFRRVNEERGMTVLLVTHESEIAAYARRTIRLRDGAIAGDERNGSRPAPTPGVPA
jgi:putative ABC transport system ATP-binding protein